MMNYMLITNLPDIARHVVKHGVNRVFVDLEFTGKMARQGHLNTVISRHTLSDVETIRLAAPDADLLVRINPLDGKTQTEVEQVLARGANIIMLPMFKDASAVRKVSQWIDGRARLIPLVETVGATRSLAEIVKIPGVSEIHIGLNDLHLELGCSFMFEPLANGLIDELAAIMRAQDIPFGIGGIARIGEGQLPAEVILGEHVRLGSSSVILSRTFHRMARSVDELKANMDFGLEISKLNLAIAQFVASPALVNGNRLLLKSIVDDIISQKNATAASAPPHP
ncbi:aldolase/citrate lyase family protein [Achromobacter spanius]|uniref:aldolase/citrate lyase family protein n=1 Tax=Achromobacter spanius TaxID=217203 RepID=UPI002227C051|nr:aldolase/citrate lyase family protein [Achromobacter spanius]MCW3151057.1 aldolase/citrate lyase family protein [Achromobacter spanius]